MAWSMNVKVSERRAGVTAKGNKAEGKFTVCVGTHNFWCTSEGKLTD